MIKDIKNYEGFYKVDDSGNIYSVTRIVKRKNSDFILHGRIMKWKFSGYAKYPAVILHKDGVSKTKTIHRIVAETFLRRRSKRTEVNHKDGNKNNNHVSNLEWCTRKENVMHSYKTGLRTTPRGSGSKLTYQDVEKMRKMAKDGTRPKELAKIFKITRGSVYRILYGDRW